MSLKYSNKECNQFVEDMEAAGYEVRHYEGRSFWKGPAVVTDNENGDTLQDVIRATDVRLQWDQMGRCDLIVYPVARGKLIDADPCMST